MGLWKCAKYLCITGVIAFFAGRILPKSWFRPDMVPFRDFAFEKKGKFYDKFRIRCWQNKVPDMSKILPVLMPSKNLSGNYKERLGLMLQETCIAETIHVILCFTGFYCLKLWPGMGGLIVALIHALFLNMPFIMIQRYNRPRLAKIQLRVQHENKGVCQESSVGVKCGC